MSSGHGTTGFNLHAFIHYRFGEGDRLYGVVDAARDHELAFAARDRFEQPIRWLFADDAGWHMTDVAPYLVPIEYRRRYPYPGSGYLDMWARRLGHNAGILVITRAEADELWQHLRMAFQVTIEGEDSDYYFRFYDPRVFRTFLPTCTAAEAREFLGPIQRVLCEAETSGRVLSCGVVGARVRMDEHSLTVKQSRENRR